MKVIMAAPFDAMGRYKGGIASVAGAILQAKELTDSFNVEILSFNTNRILRSKDSAGKLSMQNIKNARRLSKDLVKEIKNTKPEVLYFHSSIGFALFKDLLAIKKAKKKTNVKVVLHIHFAELDKILTRFKIINRFILKILVKYVDKIIFLSQSTRDEFVSHGIDKEKCHVVYNFSTFGVSENEMSAIMEKEKQNLQFLFMGSIDDRKGIFDILDCLKNVDFDYQLHVCGSCPSQEDKERFEERIELLGDKIVFHGYVNGEQKIELFKSADVLLLTSYGEGLPVVILEAFSAGCAVVTSKVGAIPEIVKDDNGILVDAGDKEKILEALNECNQTKNDKLKQQQKNNYEKSKEFTLEKFISDISAVITSV